ncbi:class I SAM-dependent methyltransferase [Carnobacteriaceae bacterium zg-ZUI240]|nr:class I SAM-dependent methyltransferase [Carnobacteriaceae bacterium zg-ZUI240]
MSYAAFAKTYDDLMDQSLYDEWANYVYKRVPKNSSIFELACGTGELAVRLAKDYVYQGSDLSENMLSLAQQKAPSLSFLQMDMQAFHLDTTVDAIVCFADSLCYLDDLESVKATFQNVFQSLKTNGKFLFDMHSIYQIDDVYVDYQFHYVDDETLFVWDSFPGDEQYSVVHEISCVNRLSNGLYERYDEQHFERTYPLDDIVLALQEIGFCDIEVTADFTDSPVKSDSRRWFFTAVKREKG